MGLQVCTYCGLLHVGVVCPRIKRITYNSTGGYAEIEFFPPQSPQATQPLIGDSFIEFAKMVNKEWGPILYGKNTPPK